MKDKLGQYYPILALTVAVFISVAVLSGMDNLTRETIQYQTELKIQRMLNQLFPEMTDYEFDESTEIYTITADDTKIGYAFLGVGVGYGGDIDIVVGMEDRTTVRGIAVIGHAETPGLGDKILEPNFTDQFVGLDISELELTRDGGKVDAITGATISSQAVVDGARAATKEKTELIPD